MSTAHAFDDHEGTDWDYWRRRMEDSSRCAEGRRAGIWALGILEEHLGPSWLAHVRRREYQLPPEVALSPFHAVAFAELLVFAVSLELGRTIRGFAKVRHVLAADLRDEARLHALLQLELAMLGRAADANVALEPRDARSYPPYDVRISLGNLTLRVEARVVLLDNPTRAGRELADRVGRELHRIEFQHHVTFAGSIGDGLTDGNAAGILAAIEEAAGRAAADQRPVMVVHPLTELRVVPQALAWPGSSYSMPAGGASGITRTLRILRGKAFQARKSGATWLRVDLLDGTWQFSSWAQQSLAEKTRLMAETLSASLADTGLRGIVISSGTATTLTRLTGQSTRSGHAFGLVRDLGSFRGRETIVVPLVDDAAAEAQAWVQLYDAEPSWLDGVLAEVGLPALSTFGFPDKFHLGSIA